MSRTRVLTMTFVSLLAGAGSAWAGGKNVALINNSNDDGPAWCQFLIENGHACTLYPKEGPTQPLDPFEVVIDMSNVWADATQSLADFMQAGKTVIAAKNAPTALGIGSNPTVKAWIGANATTAGALDLVTVSRDPILGDLPPGTFITDCGAGACLALSDLSGHPGAKPLAAFPNGPLGIMRNVWEGGVSVFITDNISPGGNGQIILNAVRARELTVPTLTKWGLLLMGLAIAGAGSAVVAKRRARARLPR